MSYVKNIDKIDHRVFYAEKASLFKEWADTNDIYGVDRHKIWKRVRHVRGIKEIFIKEGSEEWIRLKAVLDILLEADLKCLYQLMEKKYGQKKQN